MNKEIITYSAEDFIRYHRGEMTNAEMYALEKAASEDPFLEDALEGYAYTAQPENDLAELRKRFTEKKEQAKVIPLKKGNAVWWRVAAAVIFIGAAAFFFNRINQKTETVSTLAKTETKAEEKIQPVITSADTVAASDNIAQTTTSASAGIVKTIKSAPQKATGHAVKPILPPDNNADDRAKQMLYAKTVNPAEVAVYDSSSFTQEAKDLAISKKETAGQNSAMRDAGMDDIRISSASAKVKKALPVTATRLNPDSVTEFDRYVGSNIRMPAPDENNNISYKGNVVLSFSVNRKGKPVKIKTEKTVCGACDKEAIRLLKEGPDWEYDPNKSRKKVSISF